MKSSLNSTFLYRSNLQPVLVLLHGFLGDSHDWDDLANSVDNSVLMIDLPAHGKSLKLSDHLTDSYKATSQLLYKTIKSYTAKPIILLGYSLGARLAVDFTIRYSHLVSKLILESYNPGLSQFHHRKKRFYQDMKWSHKFKKSYKNALKEWYKQDLFSTLTSTERSLMISKRVFTANNETFQSVAYYSPGKVPHQWESINYLRCDTLLISGSKDYKFTHIAKDILKKIKTCKHFIIHAGHNVHFENSKAYITCIKEFLK